MRATRAIYVVAAVAVAGAVALWLATGREGYTRWPNAKLEQADAAPAAGESDLLGEIGFSDGAAARPSADIQSRFAFGLVPGGFDPKHLLSVAAVAGLAGAASVASFAIGRLGRRHAT
ncbi:MAG: hypothetical protein JNM94_10095 [Phycisphaerae bacterium]|nr:hypothetical protein [Phycisphaerae bacterium]